MSLHLAFLAPAEAYGVGGAKLGVDGDGEEGGLVDDGGDLLGGDGAVLGGEGVFGGEAGLDGGEGDERVGGVGVGTCVEGARWVGEDGDGDGGFGEGVDGG